MNTPEEHAAAVLRAPGPITVASIAGAIRAYAEEIKGSQIGERDALVSALARSEERRQRLVTAFENLEPTPEFQHKLAAVTAERDAERAARRALQMFVEHNASCGVWSDTETRCTCGLTLALALAAKLP